MYSFASTCMYTSMHLSMQLHALLLSFLMQQSFSPFIHDAVGDQFSKTLFSNIGCNLALCLVTIAWFWVAGARFGENSPLWQNPLSLWQYFEGIFSNWQKYETDLVNFVCFWANFHCYK